MSPPGRPVLTTADAWVEAGLAEIDAVGVDGLSVQAVARRLGVSKGGFYHQFADRQELLVAVLGLWEQRYVTDFGAQAMAITDPSERIHAVLVRAVVELRPTVLVRLIAAAEEPVVAAVLERAARARVEMLERTFVELGCDSATARRRAVLGYATFLGFAQIAVQLPEEFASEDSLARYAAEFEHLVLGP